MAFGAVSRYVPPAESLCVRGQVTKCRNLGNRDVEGINALRSVLSAVVGTARQMSHRIILTATACDLVALALLVPLPTAVSSRLGSSGARGSHWRSGAHVVVTVFPFPRTPFTLAAGCCSARPRHRDRGGASTLSAVIALLLVRASAALSGWSATGCRVGDARLRAAAGRRSCRCG